MIEKYTFDLHFSKKHKKLILVKNASEGRIHVLLKLLAYMLFYDERLEIEKDIGMHYKPDLVICEPPSLPELWIDCGQISLEKVDTLSRKLKQTRIVILKRSRSELRNFTRMAAKKVSYPERIEYLAFEKSFLENLAASLQKKNQLTLYPIGDTAIGVALGDEVFETELLRA